jgi:hypothetical protein
LQRTRLAWQAICLIALVLAIIYVGAFFATSRIRIFTRSPDATAEHEARIFISMPLQEVFRPLSWVESRFVEQRDSGYEEARVVHFSKGLPQSLRPAASK